MRPSFFDPTSVSKRVFLILMVCLFIGTAQASTVIPDFVKAEIAPNSTQVSLPYFMNGSSDIVFLKFLIPNFQNIASINSFLITVDLYDNGDGGGESGDIEFAQPGTNIVLATFTNLNHTTAISPAIFSIPLCPCEIAQIMPSLQDGNFRIRIARDTGDFFAAGATASLDVTFTPEPATVTGVLIGFLGLALLKGRTAITRQ